MTFEEFSQQMNAEDDFLEFEMIENKLSKHPDLHAFILLEKLGCTGKWKIISASEHDQAWIDVDTQALAEKITPEQVTELRRCGIMFDESNEDLYMFT